MDLGGLIAIVGALDGAADRTPGEARLRAHDAVVRRAAERAAALLPARFGQVAADLDVLRERVAPRRDALARALELVRGRAQMTLRVFGAPQPAAPEPPPHPTLGPGARYLAARRQAAARAREVPEAAALLDALAGFVSAARVERPAASTGLLASVYHLVERGDAERYRERAEALAPSLAPRRVSVSGPWPPYAFAPP